MFLGDTPADVEAGLDTGVRMVVVAAGRTSADELRDSGAAAVLEGLADTEQVLAAVVSPSLRAGRAPWAPVIDRAGNGDASAGPTA
ncbi:HAD hydrolase-like protein [Streptomyces silvensis]|uniref:HAD hydrolase-like protein n=1 Tax=Streptomyces silvensis TaxID=1765722 RepID=UPI000D19F049